MKQLRVGLIGAGGISHVHMAAWQSLGATVTVFSAANAPALAQKYGIAVADTLSELFAVADIVDIVTPTNTHRGFALAAIAAGKDVICEKPLAGTVAEAIEITNAAQAAGVRVFPAHVVRFFPEYAAIKKQLGDGRIGEPAVLRLSRAGQAPAAGTWFFSEPDGGGIIRDQMIHDLDQALWLAGEVTQVYAVQNPPTVDGVVPCPVVAHVTLTHANGAISHAQGAWGPKGMAFRTSIDVAGSRGTLNYASRNDGSITRDLAAMDEPVSYLPVQTTLSSPYTLQIAELANAIMDGTPARVAAVDGVMAVALAEAAAESIATGKAVDFSAATILDALLEGQSA